MAPDSSAGLDSEGVIPQGFHGTSNHDPHMSRLRNQTRFFTHLSCNIEPDITKPTSRKIVVSSDLDPDPSADLDYGGVIAQGFRGPFVLNSSCYDFEKVDEGRKTSSQLWIRIYLLFRFTSKVRGMKNEQSDVATYRRISNLYIYFPVRFEQSTVATYGRRSKIYIT